ncbi:MAG: bifunctional (p)ppGpp synthetase/guanosine-3',5'-bis(diphosphate) 3'-pyrophosphohydrolase [Gammaproteobacteria bacterium]|nr:bifunctional (p)ppGpp synthetase/guanosine-3',5'-bis(diphosphate) 3'-pyrophosphohydrolase [Gammaproteobacteria bacterium]
MIWKAKRFARLAHEAIGQCRKYTDEPYIVHPRAVAKLVSSVTDDEAMICAAWLHDVVEDTAVTIDEIRTEFGEDVAALVDDLSDVSRLEDGNRETRKRIDLEHTKTASARAKTVKLADLIDNTRSIAISDPGFAKTYMGEKRQLLKVLREGDRRLYAMATEIVEKYHET